MTHDRVTLRELYGTKIQVQHTRDSRAYRTRYTCYTLTGKGVGLGGVAGGAFACLEIYSDLPRRMHTQQNRRHSDAVSPPQRVLSSELLWRDLATDRTQQQRVQTYTAKGTQGQKEWDRRLLRRRGLAPAAVQWKGAAQWPGLFLGERRAAGRAAKLPRGGACGAFAHAVVQPCGGSTGPRSQRAR